MRRGWVLGVLVALAACSPAVASDYPTGWNGDNPFTCEVQNVGFGTSFTHPEADPFCVEFEQGLANLRRVDVVGRKRVKRDTKRTFSATISRAATKRAKSRALRIKALRRDGRTATMTKRLKAC